VPAGAEASPADDGRALRGAVGSPAGWRSTSWTPEGMTSRAATWLGCRFGRWLRRSMPWERTGGREGLPFVWFGHQKRIPTDWLIGLSESLPSDRPPAA